jgi:hypothetical protein
MECFIHGCTSSKYENISLYISVSDILSLLQNTAQVLRFSFKDLESGESSLCQSRYIYLRYFMNKTFYIISCFELYLTHVHWLVAGKQCFLCPSSQMKHTILSHCDNEAWVQIWQQRIVICLGGEYCFLLQPAKDVVCLWRCNRIVTELNISSVTGVSNHCFRGTRRIIFKISMT